MKRLSNCGGNSHPKMELRPGVFRFRLHFGQKSTCCSGPITGGGIAQTQGDLDK